MEDGPASGELAEDTPVERIRPATRRGWWVVVAILSLALALRVGEVAHISAGYVPKNDAADYDNIASTLAQLHHLPSTVIPGAEGPSAFRAPLYPLVLASVYQVVGGHSWTWGLLQQALIGSALVAMIGVMGAQLFGRRVGATAMALAAVHPTMILFGSSLQLEPLLALLELATIAAALQHRRAPLGWRWPVASGALLGLTILTREIGIWLLPVVVVLLWAPRVKESARLWRFGPVLAVGVAVAVVAPWTVRNAIELHALVPVTTTSGVVLAGVYDETSRANTLDPALWVPPWFDPGMAQVILRDPHRDEAQLDKALRSAAIDFAKDNPRYVPKVFFWNTVRLFDLQGTRDAEYISQFIPYPTGLTKLSVYSSYLVYVLAIAGALLGAARGAPKVVWLFPVLVWLNLALLSGNIRYRSSIEPFLLLLAAATVAAVHQRIRTVPIPRDRADSTGADHPDAMLTSSARTSGRG
ncbi:MAG: glycosyltransferase family 39 protein [Acidimicrobiales bacterium]